MIFTPLWFWFLKIFCCYQRPETKNLTNKKNLQKFQLMKKISTKNLNRKKTLVLDLDETLIHSSPYKLRNYDFTISMFIDENVRSTFYVAERPFLHQFMNEVTKWYDVIIFTASLKTYADLVIDKVDKSNKVIKRYYRDSCLPSKDGQYIKDLSILKIDLSRCIIVDNSEISFSKNKENGIPIRSVSFN